MKKITPRETQRRPQKNAERTGNQRRVFPAVGVRQSLFQFPRSSNLSIGGSKTMSGTNRFWSFFFLPVCFYFFFHFVSNLRQRAFSDTLLQAMLKVHCRHLKLHPKPLVSQQPAQPQKEGPASRISASSFQPMAEVEQVEQVEQVEVQRVESEVAAQPKDRVSENGWNAEMRFLMAKVIAGSLILFAFLLPEGWLVNHSWYVWSTVLLFRSFLSLGWILGSNVRGLGQKNICFGLKTSRPISKASSKISKQTNLDKTPQTQWALYIQELSHPACCQANLPTCYFLATSATCTKGYEGEYQWATGISLNMGRIFHSCV